MTEQRQSELTPDEVLQRLEAGNRRFRQGEVTSRDLNAQVEATSEGQYPIAAVLGCIDSRVPHELLFDQGIGDIFSTRVAGHAINDEVIGSLEFAAQVAGSRLIVILGHTSCGAIKGSCDEVEIGHISSLVDYIRPSVEAVTMEGTSASSDDLDLVDEIAAHNVDRTVETLRCESPLLNELEQEGTIHIVGAMYDVSTGRVTFR